jgi:DNA-binding transcriptional MerR regulator
MGRSELVRGGKYGSGASASEIPDKLYFRIGEVARLCEVPTYVLRFWESEFPQLKPNKGGTGQRLYRRRDVELALRVKSLLKDEGYTIPGARQMLKTEMKLKQPQIALIAGTAGDAKCLRSLRRELDSLVAMLAQPVVKSESTQKPALKSRSRTIVGERTVQPIRTTRPTPLDPKEPVGISPVNTLLDPASFDPASFSLGSIERESIASVPAPINSTLAEELPASTTRTPIPKATASAGFLFDLFDPPQDSEGNEH